LLRAIPFALWGSAVCALLWPRLGPLRLPVALYVAVICAMMWRAAAQVGPAGGWTALLGALLFAASDTLIAFDRFQAPITLVRYPIMALYWAGQLLLALSSRAGGGPGASPPR